MRSTDHLTPRQFAIVAGASIALWVVLLPEIHTVVPAPAAPSVQTYALRVSCAPPAVILFEEHRPPTCYRIGTGPYIARARR